MWSERLRSRREALALDRSKLSENAQLHKIFDAYGEVTLASLPGILEAVTGCRPLASECRDMMHKDTLQFHDFLHIYNAIQAGALKFDAFERASHDFLRLCHHIPDVSDS